MRRLLIGVAAVALLSSCGSRVRNWDELGLVDGATTTTAAANQNDATDTTDTTDPDDPTDASPTTAGASSPRSTAPGGPTTTVKTALPHPAPGRYTYDVATTYPADEEGPAETDHEDEEVTWEVGGSASAVLTTKVTGDDDNGFDRERYRTTSSKHEFLGSSSTFEGETSTCNLDTPVLMMQLPLSVGAKWHGAGSCTEDGVTVRISIDAEVTGKTTDRVGATSVEVMVIKATLVAEISDPTDPDNSYTSRSTVTSHVDPTTLLTISEDSAEADSDDASYVITEHRQLKSLQPR